MSCVRYMNAHHMFIDVAQEMQRSDDKFILFSLNYVIWITLITITVVSSTVFVRIGLWMFMEFHISMKILPLKSIIKM